MTFPDDFQLGVLPQTQSQNSRSAFAARHALVKLVHFDGKGSGDCCDFGTVANDGVTFCRFLCGRTERGTRRTRDKRGHRPLAVVCTYSERLCAAPKHFRQREARDRLSGAAFLNLPARFF
jgi:hypothetical protein